MRRTGLRPSENAEQLIRDGQAAERLLQDPQFADACLTVEEAVMAEWQAGTTTEAREQAYHKLMGLKAVLVQLRLVMKRGDTETALKHPEEHRTSPASRGLDEASLKNEE